MRIASGPWLDSTSRFSYSGGALQIKTSRVAPFATLLLLVSFFLHGTVASGRPATNDPAEVFGVAHVDGKYFLTSQNYLNEGADQVLATGSKVIKLYLAPRRYPWNSEWPENLHSLVDIARTPYFASVFSKPFHTYILTVYAVGRQDHYWTEGMTAEQAADETRQFYDLTKFLLQTYRGTGKTFVLQHWEGDWALRHGSPKPYDASFIPNATAVKGMIEWLNARQAGIVRARQELGETDVHVYGAAEANRLEDSMAGKPGVANSVLPFTTVDLVSYSSYGFLDTPAHLRRAVGYLVEHLPATAIFGRSPHSVYLGEFGYPENGQGGLEAVNQRLNSAFQVTQEEGLPWAIFWEIYGNEPVNPALPLPLNGKQNDKNLRGFWMVKPDGSPSLAWQRYRRLFITADPKRATTEALTSGLTLAFTDDFNRPDGKNLGPGWTQAAHYGVVNETLAGGRLRLEIPKGQDIPWGSATLDLASPGILGHGLRVGDYFEIGLRRLSEQGGLGIELYDSDQLRVGSDLNKGQTALKSWNGTTWVPVAYDERGQPLVFDWNSPHTLGVRFDSADGQRTTFSYYYDGHYAGSWLIASGSKVLNRIGIYAQSRTDGSVFEFEHLRIFKTPREDAFSLWQKGAFRGANVMQAQCTPEDLKALRSWGANLAEIPVSNVYAPTPPYAFEPENLAKLDRAVAAAEQVGLFVALTCREGPGRPDFNRSYEIWRESGAQEAYMSMWRELAQHFRARACIVGYDLMCEPHPDQEAKQPLGNWNALARRITTAIREVDPETPILINSIGWAYPKEFEKLQPTGDARTVYTVHFYDPHYYTHQKPADKIGYPGFHVPGRETAWDRSVLEAQLAPVRKFQQEFHVPIFVGEFGCARYAPGVADWMQDQLALYEREHWSWAYWAFREWDVMNIERTADASDKSNHAETPLLDLFKKYFAKDTVFPGM